jgi:hypothetical protein
MIPGSSEADQLSGAHSSVRRSHTPGVLALLALAITFLTRAQPAAADDATAAPKTLEGRWSATPLSETWSTSAWGDACGPKPAGGGAPGGTVQIARQGSELTFSGAGRPFSTAQCWDPTPGLVRTSHSAAARGWSTRCASPKGDPRVASVSTTITATDDTIVLVETGQYQFVIDDTICRASASRRRSWRLVQRAGEAAPAAPAAPSAAAPTAAPTASAAPEPPPPPRARCEPGAPARLEVSPGHKLARPGDAFDLTWRATDAEGCAVAVRPRFEVEADDPAVGKAIRVDASGRVTIAEQAPEGTGGVLVLLGGKSARVLVEIASPERFDALLAERGFGVAGEGEAAVVVLESAVGGTVATASDGSKDRRSAFVAIVVGAAAALALAALVLLRRNRRARAVSRPTEPPPAPLVALYDRPAEDEPMRCATCREVFPPGSAFCPDDGTPLVPAPKARVTPARVTAPPPPASGGKVCPTCGSRFDETAAFCGRDGTQLVRVN